jgi:molybdate transport system substrate-binding protein
LWSADTHLNVDAGLSLLKEPRIERIAIANPDLAPYGRAAKAALEKAGLWNAVQGKLVIGENIRQTAQFVQTGNAQVGFVSATHLANIPPGSAGVAWRVPAGLYPRIEQGAMSRRKEAPILLP